MHSRSLRQSLHLRGFSHIYITRSFVSNRVFYQKGHKAQPLCPSLRDITCCRQAGPIPAPLLAHTLDAFSARINSKVRHANRAGSLQGSARLGATGTLLFFGTLLVGRGTCPSTARWRATGLCFPAARYLIRDHCRGSARY
jgi:hypothetical protein